VRIEDLPLKYRLLLRAYPWRRIEPVPCARLRVPVAEACVALVTSAGLVPQGDEPFDLAKKGGDPSVRLISDDTPASTLTVHHRSDAFDRAELAADLNVAFPRKLLHDAVTSGVVGKVAARHLSFMGSITAPGRLIRETAPAAATHLVEDGVDIALLVPV
jgi:D-proline reductase (dithiol) PrdB